eukprot:3647332-Rhodomonas_salina.1
MVLLSTFKCAIPTMSDTVLVVYGTTLSGTVLRSYAAIVAAIAAYGGGSRAAVQRPNDTTLLPYDTTMQSCPHSSVRHSYH